MRAVIADKLYIYTFADNAAALAREYGLGLEIAEFSTAFNMDTDFKSWDEKVRREANGISRLMFHAPFNELCPAAIDPLIAEVTQKRYMQAYEIMHSYGIMSMVAHTGYIPFLYNEEWFVEKSMAFWREFLSGKPDGFCLYLENVLESTPDLLCEIVRKVADTRLKLCLDIGHAATKGLHMTMDAWVTAMQPFLGHVHLHNNYGKNDTHNALGDGAIHVADAICRITEAAPDATFTIESAYGRASVEWLIANGFL